MEKLLQQTFGKGFFLKWDASSEQWSVWQRSQHCYELFATLRQIEWNDLVVSKMATPIYWSGSKDVPIAWGEAMIKTIALNCDFEHESASEKADRLVNAHDKKRAGEDAKVADAATQVVEHYGDALVKIASGVRSEEYYGRRDESGNLILEDEFAKEYLEA